MASLLRETVQGSRTHPGEVLKEDFLVPLGLSANALARAIDVQPNRITGIINGVRGVTADTALRLARYFGGDPDWWMRLQAQYDLAQAQKELSQKLDAITPRAA
jgi:addiction module HigA family antidote